MVRFLLIVSFVTTSSLQVFASNPTESISAEIHPKVLQKALSEREVFSFARIEKNDTQHRFYAVMRIRATQKQIFRFLTQYSNYEKFTPFMDRSEYFPEKKEMIIEGGIFGYKLRSTVKFLHESEEKIQFEIIRGHFKGLQGKILVEKIPGSDDSLLFFGGVSFGKKWPPALIMEQGAEMALSVSGRKIRSLVESGDQIKVDHDKEQRQFPQPRSHL